MAIHVICAVRDSAVDAFMRPFYVQSVGAAIRSFGDEVNNKESPLFVHPECYELFELGLYDEQDASFAMLPKPRSIGRALDSKVTEFVKE